MKARDLKKGNVYHKNGYTIWYGQGRYYFSAFNDSSIHDTLKQIKQKIKSL